MSGPQRSWKVSVRIYSASSPTTDHPNSDVFLFYTGADSGAALDSSISYSNSTIVVSGYSKNSTSQSIALPSAPGLPSGPYFASVSNTVVSVYEAWRLYTDTDRAFFYGLVPHTEDDTSFQVLSASLPNTNGAAAIGVPSRLYYSKTVDKPLAGVRVTVKVGPPVVLDEAVYNFD